MSGPNLSQYFSNDPPSLFDEITKTPQLQQPEKDPFANIASNPFMQLPGPGDNSELNSYMKPTEVEVKVSDEIRELWEPAYCEPGIPPQLTMPSVQSSTDIYDPIHHAVVQFLGEAELGNRKVLTANDVTQDERGLRQLIEFGHYRSAINLTARLLTTYGQGYGRGGQPAKHSTYSLQLWFVRLALLVKLGLFDLVKVESEPFGQLQNPDVYYDVQSNIQTGRIKSMASFSFRVLLAEIPGHLGQHKITLNHLTKMYSIASEIMEYYRKSEDACQFWKRRVIRIVHSLINSALQMKDFSLVDNLMELLMEQVDEGDLPQKRSIYSAWGRIYLQCGYILGAEMKFAEARKIKSTTEPDSRDLIDKGLIAVAQNDFTEAHSLFQKALVFDPSNTMLLNNMGVCLLYSGNLKDAIGLLENSIQSNPKSGLNESVLLNLSTLYELESSNDTAKKISLLQLINRHNVDLNIDYCLKLQINK